MLQCIKLPCVKFFSCDVGFGGLRTLVEIMALLYTCNDYNGHLCCPDHAHFGLPSSSFVI